MALSMVRTKNGEVEGECESGKRSDKTINGWSCPDRQYADIVLCSEEAMSGWLCERVFSLNF